MAITDVSSAIVEASVTKRMRAEVYLLVIGIAAVALLGIARLTWEPSYQEKSQMTQAALATEHGKVCDQLGKSTAPDRETCVKALELALYRSSTSDPRRLQ